MILSYQSLKHWYSKPKPLEWYVSAPVPIFAVLAIVLVFTIAPRVMENLVKENAVSTAVDLTETLQKIRNYYSRNVLSKVIAHSNVESTHLHKISENGVPIPATFLIEMAQSHTENDNIKVNVTSPYPFAPRKGRVMDDFQTYAWQQLIQNPNEPVSQFDTVDGRRVVRVALPDKLTAPACVACHNAHRDSPKNDWKLGDVRGIVEIEVNVESGLERANNISLWIVLGSFLCLIVLILFNLRVARKVARPLSEITNAMTALSERKHIQTKTKRCDYTEVRTLSAAFVNFQDNELRRQALEEEVHNLAYYDTLTKVPNRASMVKFLKETIPSFSEQESLSLLIVNIDKFNEVNDTLGYSIGDQVLVAVAKRIQESCAGSIISRFNSTEFAIAYLGTKTEDECLAYATKIVEQMQIPFTVDEHNVHLSVSIGITVIRDNETSIDDAIAQANIALNHAEASETEKLVYYTPALSQELHHRVKMIKELKVASNNFELVPFFQPQIDLVSGEIIGAEALLRWIKPDGTMVSPAEFIPSAEKSRLILPIGRQVLNDACRLNKQWQDLGLKPFRVAVNVSGIQFDEDDMVDAVQDALNQSGLSPEWLELEVTESALMSDIEIIVEKLSRLRDLGIELAIDDFGTGYSSLSYLKRLPIDRLKIDQSFVRHLIQDEDDQAIAQMVLGLGKSLKLKVLAEGVEDAETRDFLKERGCDEVQGYFYAKPMSAQEFTEFAKAFQEQS
ncbi:EAL domain-containing protein [Alteromonadaceae bacterium M269]|nr:EAL domain-containing protein [Alteromonadaceae bacterium M269]